MKTHHIPPTRGDVRSSRPVPQPLRAGLRPPLANPSVRPSTSRSAPPLGAAEAQTTAAPLFRGRSVLYVQEVASHLRVTRQHVINLIEEGILPAINVNGAPGTRNAWRIPVAAFQAFLTQRGS